MKKHSGMRPHDIAVLLKIAAKGDEVWYMKDIAYELGISASEISESINRSMIAGLIAQDKKRIMKSAILEFLEYGIKYVYPVRPGAIKRGMLTAHSAAPLNGELRNDDLYVWSYSKGKVRGQEIEPLHPKIPEACEKDTEFYTLMALTDAIRVGRAREVNLAMKFLKELL
jgi:predicted transcriptional regulator